MPNLVLEDSSRMPYFTDMRMVFDALPGICSKHDWLISDLDCESVALDADAPWISLDPRLRSGAVLLTGQELETILASNTIQFSWAVFSGVPIGSKPNPPEAPHADGNPDFWHGSPKPQLDGAELEIVCWDSSCCLLLGASEELAAKFRVAFAEVLDLDEQNRSRPNASRP